jgi:hypothetical protein
MNVILRSAFLACAAMAVTLSFSTEAQAWGFYHAGYTHYGPVTGLHHYGYTTAYRGVGYPRYGAHYGGYHYGGYRYGGYRYGGYRGGYYRRW